MKEWRSEETGLQPLVVAQRKGNLHVYLDDVFTGDIARSLVSVMQEHYRGQGNIFIHALDIITVSPDAQKVFSTLFAASGLPAAKVYFKGEKGFEIGHEGAKVIVYQRGSQGGGCGGGCKKCRCAA